MLYDVLLASREKPTINKIIWWNLLFDCYSCIVGENSQLSVSPFAWQFLLSALLMMTHTNAGRKATHVLLYPVCILFKINSAFSMGYQGMTLLYCQTQNLSPSLALERHISTHVLTAGHRHKGKRIKWKVLNKMAFSALISTMRVLHFQFLFTITKVKTSWLLLHM